MFIETYIALAMLAVLVPIALCMQANRAYQRERWTQRWEQRQEQLVDEDDARVAYLDQLDV